MSTPREEPRSGAGAPEDRSASVPDRIARSLPRLTDYIRRRMGPELGVHDSVSDIVQSTCREILAGADGFEDRGDGSFEAWMRQAAENKIRNRVRYWHAGSRGARAEASGPTEVPFEEGPRPSGEAVLQEEVTRLRRAFGALSPEHRHVLVESKIHGRAHEELAQDLGRSPEAVRKLLTRAMAKLAIQLRKPGDPSGSG